MNAKDAAKLTEKYKEKTPWDGREPSSGTETHSEEGSLQVLEDLTYETILAGVVQRCEMGKSSLFVEPFFNIPGKLHMPDVEDKVTERLVQRLEKDGYEEVSWERVDKRVVLKFKWQ